MPSDTNWYQVVPGGARWYLWFQVVPGGTSGGSCGHGGFCDPDVFLALYGSGLIALVGLVGLGALMGLLALVGLGALMDLFALLGFVALVSLVVLLGLLALVSLVALLGLVVLVFFLPCCVRWAW